MSLLHRPAEQQHPQCQVSNCARAIQHCLHAMAQAGRRQHSSKHQEHAQPCSTEHIFTSKSVRLTAWSSAALQARTLRAAALSSNLWQRLQCYLHSDCTWTLDSGLTNTFCSASNGIQASITHSLKPLASA